MRQMHPAHLQHLLEGHARTCEYIYKYIYIYIHSDIQYPDQKKKGPVAWLLGKPYLSSARMKLYVARILPDALVFVRLVSANADFKLLADVVQGY